jgi:Zn-dependent protease
VAVLWLTWASARSAIFFQAADVPAMPGYTGPPTRAEVLVHEQWLKAVTDAIEHPAITEPALGWIVAAVLGTALVYALSILAHELGHLVAARRHGVEVTAVELHAFGGFVEHHDDDRLTAGSLAAIAGAGPLVTGFLALVSGALLLVVGWPLTSQPDVHSGAAMVAGYMLSACFFVNAAGLVINLLPFRGLDGGHLKTAAGMRLGRR